MDRNYVLAALNGLKSTSSSHVQESLQKLRSEVISNQNGMKVFLDCGGLDYLVPHLRKPNERILDLTLSILGNCCLNDDCRLAVGKLPIVPSLVTVLETVCRDSIVGRGCRVVGNLAQDIPNAANLHNHGAVSALISLIKNRDENTSYPTLTMAVRAIRQLWMVPDKRDEMLSVYSVKCVALLLTTECEKAGLLKIDKPQNEPLTLRRSQEELIGGILKCLAYCTNHVTSQCAEQVQGDGRGYQCLVALTKIHESQALSCLINLCYLSTCRPLLGNAGLVSCLVGMLQKNSDVSWWPEGTVRMLSQLSSESVNRARMRLHGGLPLLIAAAREHTMALRALLQYVFDDLSFQTLVNEGLVGLLTDELRKHLTTMECEHDFKLYIVRRRKDISDGNEDGLRVVIERDNMLFGFNETNDASDSQNEDETCPAKGRKRLKRARSMSPTAIRKRSRELAIGAYCNGASCSSGRSPEPPPMSPGSDANSGLSEWRPIKRGRPDWSPESGLGTGDASPASPPYWAEYQWSPSSSASPTSPFSINEESSDSEVSGRYSPVCSEHEVDAAEIAAIEATTVELDAAQVAMDELAMDDGDMAHNDEAPFEEPIRLSYLDMNSSRIACVLVLLYRLANGSCDYENRPKVIPTVPNNMLELLTGQECMDALLDFVERCRKPMGRALRILTLIFGNPLSLMNILKHKVALRLYRMSSTSKHPESKCQQCRLLKKLSVKLMTQLTGLAESRYGIGEVSYQLLRGPDSMKETLSLTLPYIVKSKAVLRKYYIECSALNVLFAAVPENPKEFEYYVTALAKFATNVKIKDPKDLEKRYSDQVCVGYDPVLDGLSKNEIVTFELDDSTTVTANRTFLCQHSEVFGAMLMGCFKESVEESVRIQNVTKRGLEYLLTLLHLGLNNDRSDVEVFPMAENLETNLEVLLLADRFLFEKLKVGLSSAILQFKMAPDSADKIYAWSLSEGMGFLCVESVAYLLAGKMSERDRSQAFKNILNLEYKDQWLDDIKSVISRQLEEWL